MVRQLNPRVPYWAYMLLFLVLVVLSFYIVARFQMPVDGIGSRVVDGECVIVTVRSDSPAEKAGLQPGDIIKKIGPSDVTSKYQKELLEPFRAGDIVEYVTLRNGKPLTFTITLDSVWSLNSGFYLALYLLILVVCTTSIFVIYKKPYDSTAQLFFIYLQLLAVAQNFRFLYLNSSYALFATIIFIFSFNLFGLVLLHFHLTFPKPAISLNRIKRIMKGAYIIGAGFSVLVTVLLILRNYNGSQEALRLFNQFNRLSISWMGLTLLLAFIAAIYQYVFARSRMTRKQLSLVLIGSFFGLVPPIFYGINPEYIWRIEQEYHSLTALEIATGTGTYIMTTFLVIAIFRYRLWNIEPFIRKAVNYGSATTFIAVTYIFLLYFIQSFLIEETRFVHFLILSVTILAFLLLRDILQRFIDRLFNREIYDSARVVTEFEASLEGIYEFDTLKSKIVQVLNGIFHFKSFVFALRETHDSYFPIYINGVADTELEKKFQVSDEISLLIRRSHIFSTEELREKPDLFEITGGELIVPLLSGNDPLGFFIIGPKISERSYSLQDIRILSLVAKRVVAHIHTADLYKKNLDKQIMLERERTRIAKDIHDDVGASLTRISIMSENLKAGHPDKRTFNKWLDQISETSRDITREMTQIVWAISPKNDTANGLIAYIRRYAFEYLEPFQVNCNFDIPEGIPSIKMGVEIRRNIYLCVRESIHNIVKHSEAMNVWISHKIDEQGFWIIIKDDGKGFDPCLVRQTSNGLLNMKKRMRTIGGKIRIQAKSDTGTEISLMVPDKSLNYKAELSYIPE